MSPQSPLHRAGGGRLLHLLSKLSLTAWVAILSACLTAFLAVLTLDRRSLGGLVANIAAAVIVLGTVVAILGISLESNEKYDADINAAVANNRATNEAEEVDYIRNVTGTTGDKVSDLAALSDLAPGGKFSVVISHSSLANCLKKYPKKIRNQFSIPDKSNQVCVMATSAGDYVLVFGRHLNLSSAEVYKTLADSHGYGPMDKDTGLPELGRIEPDLPGECYQFTGKEPPCPKKH